MEMEQIYASVSLILFGVLLGTAALFDIGYRIIPNRVCGVLLILGFVVNGTTGGRMGVLDAFLGVLVALVVFLPQYAMKNKKMGAGDVKLIASAGAFLGLFSTIDAIILTYLAGGVLALGALLARQGLVLAPQLLRYFSVSQDTGRIYLPFGVAIAAGAMGANFVSIVRF